MYTDTYDTGMFSALFGALFGLFIVTIIIIIVLCILIVIGKWKILKKGGQNGWAALIPYYSDWELCKMTGICPYWALIMFIMAIINTGGNGVIGVLILIVSLYYKIILNVSLAKSFGKDPAYAIGLIIVPWIFYPMLGLGAAEYIGAKPMKDIILEAFNKNDGTAQQNTNTNQPVNPQTQSMNTQPMNNQPMNNQPMNNQPMNNQPVSTPEPNATQQNAFCTNCGAPLTSDSTFCTNCGTKVN